MADDGLWRHTERGANIGQSSAWWWSQVVTLQLRRILAEHNGMIEIMDANLLVLALRQVIRGAEMTETHAATGIGRAKTTEALAAFEAEIPGGKPARDIIEHYDEYTQGVGNLQQPTVKARAKRQPDEANAEAYRVGFEWERTDAGRRPVLLAGPYRIDLISAEDAAFRLQCGVYEALLADEGRPVQKGWAYSVQRPGPLEPVHFPGEEYPL